MNRPKPFVKAQVDVSRAVRERGPRSAGLVDLGAGGETRRATGVFDGRTDDRQ